MSVRQGHSSLCHRNDMRPVCSDCAEDISFSVTFACANDKKKKLILRARMRENWRPKTEHVLKLEMAATSDVHQILFIALFFLSRLGIFHADAQDSSGPMRNPRLNDEDGPCGFLIQFFIFFRTEKLFLFAVTFWLLKMRGKLFCSIHVLSGKSLRYFSTTAKKKKTSFDFVPKGTNSC